MNVLQMCHGENVCNVKYLLKHVAKGLVISATEFIKQDDIRIIDIESVNVVLDKPNYYWSPIVDNETACWVRF